MTTLPRIVPDDDVGRREAVRVLKAGGIVALPTDTVYGIGVAWARSPDAIGRLFAAKGRPAERPIALLLADADQARELATWPPAAEHLASVFWPGGLTIVVAQSVSLPPELTGGRSTIGLRVPDHSCPRTLAATLGLAVTSANRSGESEAADAREIRDQLGDAIDLILDGGPARGGPPSTVVDCSSATPRILRAGAIPAEAIARTLREAGLPEPAG